MINFRDYPEMDPFITQDNIISEVGRPEPEFKETPFNTRRLQYINYLNIKERYLNNLLTLAQSSGLDSTSRQMQKILNDTPASIFFEEGTIESLSANCLGTDMVYDFYINILQYGSKLEGLGRYNEIYVDLYENAYEVVNQIFNKIGTRGQLYGYLDNQIIIYTDFLDSFITELENATTSASMLSIIANRLTQFITIRNSYENNILLGAVDMRLIITPMVKYINLMNIGSKIVGLNFGTLGPNTRLKNIFYTWNKTVYNFDGDYVPKYKAIASQINEQLFAMVSADRSNQEILLTKSIKLAFDETGISADLIQTKNNMIIPNY